MTSDITISGQPRVVHDPRRIGTGIEVPLNRAPDSTWASLFQPRDPMVRQIEILGDVLRVWPASTDFDTVLHVLEMIEEELAGTNQQVALLQRREGRSEDRTHTLDSELAAWWGAKVREVS